MKVYVDHFHHKVAFNREDLYDFFRIDFTPHQIYQEYCKRGHLVQDFTDILWKCPELKETIEDMLKKYLDEYCDIIVVEDKDNPNNKLNYYIE